MTRTIKLWTSLLAVTPASRSSSAVTVLFVLLLAGSALGPYRVLGRDDAAPTCAIAAAHAGDRPHRRVTWSTSAVPPPGRLVSPQSPRPLPRWLDPARSGHPAPRAPDRR